MLIPTFVRCCDGIGRVARWRHHQRADPRFRLSPTTTGGVDDVLTLVEQLDVATSALHEESREADQLCLSVAAVKQEMAAVELATIEA